MFFTPGTHKDHGLPYSPFKAIVAPRPIGWISTVSKEGIPNLAPYSFFNAMSELPPMVGFSSSPGSNGEPKDSLINIQDTGEFVVNIVSKDQINAMSDTSADLSHKTSEFDFAGLTPEPSELVAAPRVKGAPCQLECKLWDILPMPEMAEGLSNKWVMGKVIGIHIQDEVIVDGKVDVMKYNPAARLGYMDYATVDHVFEIERPKTSG
ncbi:MAG: flavin reductase family protein [Alphaproteobacteria bacterium]|nr:flavin reductase family protein [Alphaproteobacteria bacterium]